MTARGAIDDGDYHERVLSDGAGTLIGVRRVYAVGRSAPDGEGSPRGKRLFDLVFALLALALAWPLLAAAAAAILLADGRPVLFVHRRQTAGGRTFGCLKFRTMRRDAERLKDELAGRNRADGPQFHLPDDPRLLRVGRVLRRWHLDELPQLFNVLAGNMSIVGPRPSPDEENRFCPAWREARLAVRPGLTGLWQVRRTRRPGVDFQEWIRYDLEYMQHRSLALDLRIVAATLPAILRPRAAG